MSLGRATPVLSRDVRPGRTTHRPHPKGSTVPPRRRPTVCSSPTTALPGRARTAVV
jgi:hypothetical protein